MDSMNIFIGSSKAEFREFIDQICAVPLKAPTKAVSPSYATPIQILGRLPGSYREGFPSLPYLIDSPQRFANLMSLWLDHCPTNVHEDEDASRPLQEFHHLCVEIQRRTRECAPVTEHERTSNGRTDLNDDLAIEEEDILSETESNTPQVTTRPSTGTTVGSNDISASQNGFSSNLSSPYHQHEALDPADDATPSSASSAGIDPRAFSRLKLKELQGSVPSSKSSSTLSFHRPFVGRDRPSYSSQNSS